MSDFAAKFLRESGTFFSRRAKRAITLAAFGKHPGWDDHMDGIGLETESLVLAKQILYVEGIGGLINTGEWEKLAENQRLAGFKHLFVWKRGEAFLLGKIWASRDGKRRDKYPMILCLECRGISLAAALAKGLPVLDTCEQDCKEATSASGVREVIARAREQLSRKLAEPEPGNPDGAIPESFGTGKFGADGGDETFYRILYYLRTQMPYNLVSPGGGGEWKSRAGRIRVPVAPDNAVEALARWIHCVEIQLNVPVPILAILPLAEPWLDLLIGRPAPAELQVLRSNSLSLPVVSDIPFEISDQFRKENAATIRRMQSPDVSSTSGPAKSKSNRNWLERLFLKG